MCALYLYRMYRNFVNMQLLTVYNLQTFIFQNIDKIIFLVYNYDHRNRHRVIYNNTDNLDKNDFFTFQSNKRSLFAIVQL